MATEFTNLTGHLLVATSKTANPHFFRSVIYLSQHTASGVQGIAINKPLGIPVESVLEHLGCAREEPVDQPVMVGGPQNLDQGYLLHKTESRLPNLTCSPGDLDGVVHSSSAAYIFALGHMRWSIDALSAEILDNVWHVVFLDQKNRDALLFNAPSDDLWAIANSMINYRRDALSLQVGNA